MKKDIYTYIVLCLVAFGFSANSPQAIAGCTQSVTSDKDANTCIGTSSLYANTTGYSNTAHGYSALIKNTTGHNNTAMGDGASYYNTTGYQNTAVGALALTANVNGDSNSALGYFALNKNTTGYQNVAIGTWTLPNNTDGYVNTAVGVGALSFNTIGGLNTAVGSGALNKNTSGFLNVGIGFGAGKNLTTGSNNIDIGNQGVAAESATIRIGTLNTHTRTFIAGIRGVTVSGGAAVYVKSDGQLGTVTSSRRFKENIQPMGDVSNRLMSLQPVTFRYKEADSAGNKPIQYGLIAEDVDLVMPEIVVCNEDGLPETVAYHVLPSLLLNEYQKQHKELSDTKVKLAVYDDALTKEHLALLDAREKIAVMHADMELMKQTIDRLIAVLPRTTAAMLQQQ